MSDLVITRIDEKARLPKRATSRSAGLDLYSTRNVTIPSKKNGVVPTGLKITMPEGAYGRIAPRSGLALHYMLDVMGGVVDPDYEGEVKIILMNHSDSDFNVCTGDRVAQLILEKYQRITIITEKFVVDSSSDEDDQVVKRRSAGFEDDQAVKRGSAGFGSTGSK